ncbi:hypothetical protein [Streptomyces kebangsaanensis]|uniref:FXSXX-COOH protein n=1 Tax=Streptomyces kebangsaanensis TaxID=864058 RepID=A0ABW6KW79_9ACTN|nr:hypothetical protein [Streptomyces kebangsaanensis]
MDQPPAPGNATAAARASATTAGAEVWQSDLADLAALPLTAVDGLAPLRPGARLLDEVLRARSSMRGGGEPGRAE